MRLVHFADTHLGFRKNPDGDRSEAGVAATFARVIDRVIEARPDVVVIGGDVFHYPRPTTNAIMAAITGFGRLSAALPATPIIIAAGNHDLSKETANACILRALEPLGVRVADRQAVRFYFPERDLSVLAVPDAPGVDRPLIVPDSRTGTNVLVLHGEVQGMRLRGERAPHVEISRDELGPDRWSFIALGHYHCYTELAANMYYAGSIDYTSSDPWSEITTPKGFILRDLASGAHEFVRVDPTHPYIDLPPIDAHDLTAEQLDAATQEAIGSDLSDAYTRLVVHGVTKEVSRALDQKSLRAAKRRTFLLNLDLRRPERAAREPIAATYEELRSRSLGDILMERAGKRELSPGVDRGEFTAGMQHYFDLATQALESTLEKSIAQTEAA